MSCAKLGVSELKGYVPSALKQIVHRMLKEYSGNPMSDYCDYFLRKELRRRIGLGGARPS